MSDTYRKADPITFGEFKLDPSRATLTRNGKEIRLRPKPFDVLCYLAGHPRRIVSREELLEAGATALGTSSGPQLLQALRAPIASESTE